MSNIDRIYNEILIQSNIEKILEYYNLNINKNKLRCPFHNDKVPSMSVQKEKNFVKCFSCGATGNAITFIQKYENEVNHNYINRRQAAQKAIDIQGLNIVFPNKENLQASEADKKRQKLIGVLDDAMFYTESILWVDKYRHIIEYLRQRNLKSETIQYFGLGYAPHEENIFKLLSKKYSNNELLEVGLIKKDQYGNVKNVFENRIMIPIYNDNGNIVGFGARALNKNDNPKYLNTSSTELFKKGEVLFNYHNAKHFAINNELIVVEGYFDVIAAKQMGFENAVAILGTAITNNHIKLFKNLNAEITLALDNDEAGKEAMLRIIPSLIRNRIETNVLEYSKLGEYKDFGDLNQSNILAEQIYSTKKTAFYFLMEQKYVKNKEMNVKNINDIYFSMKKDGIINTTKDEMQFKEYITNVSNYSNNDIDFIIHSTDIKTEKYIDRYKEMVFYYYIVEQIKKYASNVKNIYLEKYINKGLILPNYILKTLNDSKYIYEDKLVFNVKKYVEGCLLKSEEFLKFKNNKLLTLDMILENVHILDANNMPIKIVLNDEQKNIIINQYNNSFTSDIKEIIECFQEEYNNLYIINSEEELESLFPKTYPQFFKEKAINRFKEGAMEVIRYSLAFSNKLKDFMSEKYVKDGKFMSVLVFNNLDNTLSLSNDSLEKYNVIELENSIAEKSIEFDNDKKEDKIIYIKLKGNEVETKNGIYIMAKEKEAVYIPKTLYIKDDNGIKVVSNNNDSTNIGKYEIIQTDLESKREWKSNITLQQFYKNYKNLYEEANDSKEMV